MKINFENLIERIKQDELKLNALLLFGNTGGTITGLIKIIYDNIKQKNNIGQIYNLDGKNAKEITIDSLTNNRSLFSKKNFIVVKNTSDKICNELEKIEFKGNIIVINGEGIKSYSKIKKYFDAHKVFISVPCYDLKRIEKTKIIDKFISNNNITLEKDAYWYVIENISDNYLILVKELEKISTYSHSSISIENLKMLLIRGTNANLDELFFKCANKNPGILLEYANSFIKSQSDSRNVVETIKKFVQILYLASINKEINNFDILTNTYLPKYLFMKKEDFKNILKKISFKKIAKINNLIQKTEVLLRKNSALHLEVTQRFLLNFSKLIR